MRSRAYVYSDRIGDPWDSSRERRAIMEQQQQQEEEEEENLAAP